MVSFFIFAFYTLLKNIDIETLLKAIKTGRKAKGISQKKMAELLNVSQRMYARYESNESEMTASTLLKIVQILDLDIFKSVGLINENDFDIIASIIDKYRK